MSNQQFQNDHAMQEYFDALPTLVQESIKQSGTELCNLQEMKDFANKLLAQNPQG